MRHLVFASFIAVPAIAFWILTGLLTLSALSLFSDDDEVCNVAQVPIHGIMTASDTGIARLLGMGAISGADAIVEQILSAEENEDIVAIIIDINSPGGTPVAADLVMRAFVEAKKPIVAVVRDLGASAAYWAAAGTDHIIASPISEVGSIGVTMSYVELAGANEEEGSRWIDLSSGAFKDAGNPDRILREEEQIHFQSQVDEVYDYMVGRIADSRDMSVEKIKELADGRTYLGSTAIELGLIDELGGSKEVYAWIGEMTGLTKEELVTCSTRGGGLSDLLF